MAEEPKNIDKVIDDSEKKKQSEGKNVEAVTAEQVQEMLKAAREEARKEEKNKLYKDLKKTEEKISELSSLYDQIKAERDEKEVALQKEKESKLTLEEKIEAMREKSEKAFSEIGKSLDEKLNEYSTVVQDLEQKLSRSQLDAFKEKRLRELTENDIGFIPELVAGSTPEEIDQSIELSVKRMKELAEKVTGKTVEGEKFKFPKATTPNAPPSIEDEVITKASGLRPTDEKAFYDRLKALGSKNSEDHSKITQEREKIKEELRRKWELANA